MSVREIKKELAGYEDMSFGEGTVQQTRNGTVYSISRIGNIKPVALRVDLQALEVTNPDRYFKWAILSGLTVAGVSGGYFAHEPSVLKSTANDISIIADGSALTTGCWIKQNLDLITATLTAAEIKVLYEDNADTNAYTDAEVAKLAGIEASADVTDATNVNAAGAVMHSDVTPSNGLLLKTASETYTTVKINHAATAAPAVTNDSSQGYGVGSSWINITLDNAYICLDSSVGAAIWALNATTSGAVASVIATAPIASSGGANPNISLSDDGVTNAKLANVGTQTIKGRITASTGDPEDLTAAQVRAVLGLTSIGWAISIGRYSGNYLSITAQDGNASGVAFSSDGTNMYIAGSNTDAVYQYTLTTAWDVSTGSYSANSVSVAAQDIIPQDLTFSVDGTKLYVLGGNSDTVYQYTLGTAWNLSTASYAALSFSVAAQETGAAALAFSADGLRMYVLGSANDTVYQYTLGTAWNVSTCSYSGESLSITALETQPTALAFSSDGYRMYILGVSNHKVYQYDMANASAVSSGVYSGYSLSVWDQDSNATGLVFSADGTNMYIMGNSADIVRQYRTGFITLD